MVRNTRNHYLHLQVQIWNATRQQPPNRERFRLLGQSAYQDTPFLVNGKVAKTTSRSKSKLAIDVLSLILEDTVGMVVTSDLEDTEAASKEGEV